MTEAENKELSKYYPECGPCIFCGHPDKRHRLWDAWLSMMEGGDSVEFIAGAYEAPVAYVEAVKRIRPYKKTSNPLHKL